MQFSALSIEVQDPLLLKLNPRHQQLRAQAGARKLS
jgi:hypothetical protein